MTTVSIDEAKTNLSQLIEDAVHGEPFVIVREGKPLVRVTAMEEPGEGGIKRLDFLAGRIAVPREFNRDGEDEIAALFDVDK